MAAAVLLWSAGIGVVAACPICFSGLTVTPGQRIDSADDVVIAAPAPGGDSFLVVEVVKGDWAKGARIDKAEVTSARTILMAPDGVAEAGSGGPMADGPALLVGSGPAGREWQSLGPIDPRLADWLRALARTGMAGGEPQVVRSWPLGALGWSDIAAEAWPERVRLIGPYLESDQPLAAEIAFGELSRAPHSARAALRSVVDPRAVRAWIEDPDIPERRSAYLLLLGVVGNADDEAMLDRAISAAHAAHGSQDLAAMLAAALELDGPQRLAAIVDGYLVDPERSFSEVEAALLALSVLGSDPGGPLPRAHIVEAYRAFIAARPGMAGFVATDLTDWQEWDLADEYVAILREGHVQDPAERFAISAYITQSPDQSARAALEGLEPVSQ